MKIISFTNQKGGCGKTTLAVNVAASLARSGRETLLVDLDPQAHATYALGYRGSSAEGKTSYDIFKAHFDDAKISFGEIVITDREKLSLIPSNLLLSAAEINLGNSSGAAGIFSKKLLDPFFAKYEYVIIDTPPSFGFLTLNAMYAADIIIVPVDLSYFSFNGISNIYRVTELLNRETGRKPPIFFVLNIFDKRSNFAKRLVEDARKRLGPYLFFTQVRSSVRLREAAKVGKTIYEHDPKCPAALDFHNLTNEIIAAESRRIDTIVQKFLFHAPEAGAVYVLGDFNDWQKTEASRLSKLESGYWTGHFTLDRGRYRYKFLVDDEWIQDPENPNEERNVFGTTDSILDV